MVLQSEASLDHKIQTLLRITYPHDIINMTSYVLYAVLVFFTKIFQIVNSLIYLVEHMQPN